jgi:hypothetical protein
LPTLMYWTYRTCSSTGEFQLGSAPEGEVTCDIESYSGPPVVSRRRLTDPALLDVYVKMVEKGHLTRNELRCLIGFPPL